MVRWFLNMYILGSIVVSIPACHAGDPGSIPGRGVLLFVFWKEADVLRHINTA